MRPTLVDRMMQEAILLDGMVATRLAWLRAMTTDGDSDRAIDYALWRAGQPVEVVERNGHRFLVQDGGCLLRLDPVRDSSFGRTVPAGAACPLPCPAPMRRAA